MVDGSREHGGPAPGEFSRWLSVLITEFAAPLNIGLNVPNRDEFYIFLRPVQAVDDNERLIDFQHGTPTFRQACDVARDRFGVNRKSRLFPSDRWIVGSSIAEVFIAPPWVRDRGSIPKMSVHLESVESPDLLLPPAEASVGFSFRFVTEARERPSREYGPAQGSLWRHRIFPNRRGSECKAVVGVVRIGAMVVSEKRSPALLSNYGVATLDHLVARGRRVVRLPSNGGQSCRMSRVSMILRSPTSAS